MHLFQEALEHQLCLLQAEELQLQLPDQRYKRRHLDMQVLGQRRDAVHSRGRSQAWKCEIVELISVLRSDRVASH